MRTEIIVDIGINFGGDIEIAKGMIGSVKNLGGDVAKFQLYDPRKLLKPNYFNLKDWQYILKSELSKDQTKELFDFCGKVGIEFMASAFDLERLEWLEEFGVKRHKIASRSIYDFDYVEEVKKTKKDLIISMGWLTERGVDPRLLGVFDEKTDGNKERFWNIWNTLEDPIDDDDMSDRHFLYCISKYPSIDKDLVNFPVHYPLSRYTGFSDHTEGITAAMVAIARGATIVEKHFTLYKEGDGPDHVGAMEPNDLQFLCEYRDQVAGL